MPLRSGLSDKGMRSLWEFQVQIPIQTKVYLCKKRIHIILIPCRQVQTHPVQVYCCWKSYQWLQLLCQSQTMVTPSLPAHFHLDDLSLDCASSLLQNSEEGKNHSNKNCRTKEEKSVCTTQFNKWLHHSNLLPDSTSSFHPSSPSQLMFRENNFLFSC